MKVARERPIDCALAHPPLQLTYVVSGKKDDGYSFTVVRDDQLEGSAFLGSVLADHPSDCDRYGSGEEGAVGGHRSARV